MVGLKLTVIEFVTLPDAIVAPVGSIQTKEVADGDCAIGIEKTTPCCPWQTAAGPVGAIVGVSGVRIKSKSKVLLAVVK